MSINIVYKLLIYCVKVCLYNMYIIVIQYIIYIVENFGKTNFLSVNMNKKKTRIFSGLFRGWLTRIRT